MRLIPACTVFMLFALAGAASAQTWQPPSDSQRCPSKWGKGDQRGSGNHMKPESVLTAARLIKTGEVFEFGRVLQESMPMPAGRRFEIITKRTRDDPGTNHRRSNEAGFDAHLVKPVDLDTLQELLSRQKRMTRQNH